MVKKRAFRLSHNDETVLAREYFEKGGLGLRVPGSGCGEFKGDVFGMIDGRIDVLAHRRSQNGKIEWSREEIDDLLKMVSLIKKNLACEVQIRLVAIFGADKDKKRVDLKYPHADAFPVTVTRDYVVCWKGR